MSLPPLPTISSPATPPRPISILLINPNSTPSMTTACLASLAPTLPPNTTVTGFTAPPPAPTAIESHADAVLSAAACLRAIIMPLAPHYDAFLVACYSAHPLIEALREEVRGPVMGIMEASLYAGRILGGRVGIVAMGARSRVMHEDAVRGYGLGGFFAGCECVGLRVLELEMGVREEVMGRVEGAARRLVEVKGADCVALGCAGMTEMRGRVEGAVGGEDGKVMVLDGVGLGVQFLCALVREGLGTAKGGVYRSSEDGRRARGQDWL